MEGLLSKKEKAAKADDRLMMKFGKHRWRVKLYLTNVLQFIIIAKRKKFAKGNSKTKTSLWSICHSNYRNKK